MLEKRSNRLKTKNFPLLSTVATSDNGYILRKMLLRGSAEAYYRYRLYEGDKAFDFKRMAFQLEDIIDDLDSMLDNEGGINVGNFITIIKAVQNCQYLLALDHAETTADYWNLMMELTRDVCPECHKAMVAA